MKHIDYYFATVSPWAFLGHDRLVAMARQHGAKAVQIAELAQCLQQRAAAPERIAVRLHRRVAMDARQ